MATLAESPQDVAQRVMLQAGDVLHLASGTYRVSRVLGEGGFGIVFQVNTEDDRSWALKVLKLWEIMPRDQQELADRFVREYKAGQIDSPFIVRSMQYGQLLGNPYIVMEYCAGGSLHDHRHQYREERRLTPVALRMLQGMEDLHQNGVIHRDLKPENVLFDDRNEPRLTDFGISGYVNKRATHPNWRGHVKQVWGTAVYLPPEQHDVRTAFRTLGPQTDVFAFGVMMYEILSGGQFPFGSFDDFLADQVGFFKRVQAGSMTPIQVHCPTLSSAWINVIEGSIHPNLEERIQTPREVMQHLGAAGMPLQQDPHDRGAARVAPGATWTLRIMHGDAVGMRYNLTRLLAHRKRSLLTLGWLDEEDPYLNDIGLLDRHTPYLSSRHATLEFRGQQWYLRDGQWCDKHNTGTCGWHHSTNGTYVNYVKVNPEAGCVIHPGDIIRVGDTTLKIEVAP